MGTNLSYINKDKVIVNMACEKTQWTLPKIILIEREEKNHTMVLATCKMEGRIGEQNVDDNCYAQGLCPGCFGAEIS